MINCTCIGSNATPGNIALISLDDITQLSHLVVTAGARGGHVIRSVATACRLRRHNLSLFCHINCPALVVEFITSK
ncbi:hypothetical protein J6590_043414 [Homalodisca vitripennis]|nr:hypothetical protein J6590_043414 [Homalodisca vitripennis]